jgi:hypothetical protein
VSSERDVVQRVAHVEVRERVPADAGVGRDAPQVIAVGEAEVALRE